MNNKDIFKLTGALFFIAMFSNCMVHKRSVGRYTAINVIKKRSQQDSAIVIGKVYDLTFGYSIEAGFVSADNIKTGTFLDKTGNFKLVLPPGKYKLHFGGTAYEDFITKKINCSQGSTTIVNFFVKSHPVEYDANSKEDANSVMLQNCGFPKKAK